MNNYLNEFKNPGARFRGKPFWSWNCKLEKEKMLNQIPFFKEMGMGGFTIHCRTGLDTEYLGKEFMEIVKACVKRAQKLGMEACLYDEDRWPSGYGSGRVTAEEKYRARYLVFSPRTKEEICALNMNERPNSTARAFAQGNGKELARFKIELENGKLKNYKRLSENETSNCMWYAYMEIAKESPWFNNQTYVNTLDSRAVERFLETTHDVYYRETGEYFGTVIPSIFTDEPQFTHKTVLGKADEKKELIIPYTDDFEDTFKKAYGSSFLDHLPEVFWELASGQVSVARYHYHDHVAERFAEAYCDTIGKWCRDHGISLTGHMMEEPTLQSQTGALGEAMRHYRAFDIPGIDMLCDWREYSTAKQTQSAAAQMGKKQITSELYGVTNWDFDFRDHKLQGDWQAALGVTNRVHHLSWVSMEGEAKRDYPASIFYQSPWYKKYHIMETYFARINTALQSGIPRVRIGVIHPIESYWIVFGPDEHTSAIREKMQNQFQSVTECLLFGLLDFHYISESLLEEWNTYQTEKQFWAGKCAYDVIIVPGNLTLRSSTVRQLSDFCSNGGKVIFMGEMPKYVDAVCCRLPKILVEKSICIDFNENVLMQELEKYREVDIKNHRGCRSRQYLYQMRKLENDNILFLANGKSTLNKDIPMGEVYSIVLWGEYIVTELDPMSGEKKKLFSRYENGNTIINRKLYDQDSLLLYLQNGRDSSECLDIAGENTPLKLEKYLHFASEVERSEPNVLLLDQAEYALDDEKFRKKEEVLRIDNILREELGYPLKMEALTQPWVTSEQEDEAVHTLKLKYEVYAACEKDKVCLGLEKPEEAKICWNGQNIQVQTEGFFVDHCIEKISLGKLKKGVNELIIQIPYHKKSNLEWCYLLGEFGVDVQGSRAIVTILPDLVAFSDLTLQKFPFYAGNFSWISEIEVEEGEYELEITKFRSPLLEIQIDGKEVGTIWISPYRLNLGKLKGKHQLKITAYGNRRNAFGTVHNCNEQTVWYGPEAWRTEGSSYSYEYQLASFGILSAPRLWRR